jgi:hypothetical protein
VSVVKEMSVVLISEGVPVSFPLGFPEVSTSSVFMSF